MTSSTDGSNGEGRKPYMAPAGIEPADYLNRLEEQGHAAWASGDYKAAVKPFQQRVGPMCFYYGADTIWAAKATGDLAVALLMAREIADAMTWASHTLRAYEKLLQSSPKDASLQLHLKTFRLVFPEATDSYDARRSGIADLTSGRVIRA